MPEQIVSPEQFRNAGKHEFVAVAIPDDAVSVEAAVTRAAWPDTGQEVVTLAIEISLDGGDNWMPWVSCGAPGGDHIRGDDTVSPETSVRRPIPAGTNRMARTFIEVKTPLGTAVKVRWQ